MEKPLRGKPKPGFPLRLEIPQHQRDSHFPTATTADITSPTFEPSKLPSPCVASRSSISAPPGGYDVTRLFQISSGVRAARGRLLYWLFCGQDLAARHACRRLIQMPSKPARDGKRLFLIDAMGYV